MDSTESCVPPGFRFHPTDEELVGYYLRKKVASQKIDLDVIRDIDLYRIEPWDLQEQCRIGYDEQTEWYFFSHKDKKYPTGTRTNRATMVGFWKATGRDKAVHDKTRLIGMRKTLVFYKGRAPNGQKTDWIMHEYRLESEENAPPQEEGWVVCRAFKKRTNVQPRAVDAWDSPYCINDPGTRMLPHVHNLQQFCNQDATPEILHSNFFVTQLPQLENPSTLPAAKRPNIVPHNFSDDIVEHNKATTTDWRALDKFVASQLSPDASDFAVDKRSDMEALLLLQGSVEEECKLSELLSSTSGPQRDVGICIFDK